MKKYLLLYIATSLSLSLFCQNDEAQIRAVLDSFIVGTNYSYPQMIEGAYHPKAQLFLHNRADTVLIMSPQRYAALFGRRAPGTYNNRPSKVLQLDIVLDVAYAKVQVDIPSWRTRYYDLIFLKKIDGHWKIVTKVTDAEPMPQSQSDLQPKPQKEVVLDQLRHPWSMAFLSEKEALIAEKDGDLLRVNLETKERLAIQGLPQDVQRALVIDTSHYEKGVFFPQVHGKTVSFNAGWFQVLLDPDFKNNQWIYLSYAATNAKKESALKVIRGKLQNDRIVAVQTLLLAAPYSHGLFHYGGGMVFGPDGKLYISTGERNLFEHLNPVPPLSQDQRDLRGKIIRINPDGSIPADNPDFGPNAVKGLYAMGIRATQGLALRPGTEEIWLSEHGTIQGDEINLLKAGANYGWPHQTSGEYRSKNYHPHVPEGSQFTDPVYYWRHTVAPTGLCFYRGNEFPGWQGDLIVPGLSQGSLWRIRLEGEAVVSTEEILINDRVRLRKAIVSPRGQLYLLSDEDNGKLIRLKNVAAK